MSRTVNLKLTGRAAHGQDDIEVVTDYSLQSREYYLREIEAEKEFIRIYHDRPGRYEAQANIDYCLECLEKLDKQDEQQWKALAIAVSHCPPEPNFDPRTPEQMALDEWQADMWQTQEDARPGM